MTPSAPARWGLRGLAFGYLGLLLLAPVGMIFYKTFEHGLGPPIEAMTTAPRVSRTPADPPPRYARTRRAWRHHQR